MIKQVFSIESYWKVIVFYNLDYNLFSIIEDDLKTLGISDGSLEELYNVMSSGKAKAVTYSNLAMHTSIVLFNPHKTKSDYINSIVHEAEHVKQAILKVYNVEDEGEPPAYTIGYIISRMWEVFKTLMCGFSTS